MTCAFLCLPVTKVHSSEHNTGFHRSNVQVFLFSIKASRFCRFCLEGSEIKGFGHATHFVISSL